MLAGLAVDVHRLARELGARRMDRLAAMLEDGRHRVTGRASGSPGPARARAARPRSRRRATRGRARSARRRTARAWCDRGHASRSACCGGARARRSSRTSRLTWTGSRAIGAWPAPSIATSRAPVSSATSAPRSNGMTWSRVPWTIVTGQETLRHSACHAGLSCGSRSSPSMLAISASGVVSSPHATQSSICLVECGSRKDLARRRTRGSRGSRAASGGGCTSPTPRSRRARRRSPRLARGPDGTAGEIATTPATRSG